MSSPIPMDFSSDLLPSSQPRAVVSCECANGASDKLFKDILADENLVSDIMAELKATLPEDLYAQIEQMVESGNGLPLAAIFSPESPLFKQILTELPQTMQDAFKLNGGQITALMASVLKTGEDGLQKLGSGSTGRELDLFGSNINESVSQYSAKCEGLGKQIHDLLVAAKTESSQADGAPKIFLATTASTGDGSMTQGTAIGTAINGLTQLSNFPVNSGITTPPPITVPMGEEAWGQAMGDRIMWMMGKGVQGASIRINPPELGPIQVQLSVKNDQTSVHMLVQHGAVKDALEASIPRLREMLGDSNLNLVNVDVSHRESPDQSSSFGLSSQDQREQMEQFLRDHELSDQIEEELPRYYRGTGLLDDYA